MTDLSKFVKDAIRTESRIDVVNTNEQLLRGALTTLISAGNILDMIKKNVFYGKSIDNKRLRELVLTANVGVIQMDPTMAVHRHNTEFPQIDPRLFHALVGIATESTELLEALEKILDGSDPDTVNIGEELGDINWYEAIAVDTLDLDFESILNVVIAKLKARFPEKFTSESAINRDLDAERKILEGK